LLVAEDLCELECHENVVIYFVIRVVPFGILPLRMNLLMALSSLLGGGPVVLS
jgi:hypothetical protein